MAQMSFFSVTLTFLLLKCSFSVHTEYQDKTYAIGPDLELHNSNYMYSNAPRYYTARIPFLHPTWVHKTGGNMHTLYMLEARGALRRY